MYGEIMFNTSAEKAEFRREAKILKDHLGDTMQDSKSAESPKPVDTDNWLPF